MYRTLRFGVKRGGEPEVAGQFGCRRAAGAVCTDRRRRRAVADQMNTWIARDLGRKAAGNQDATARFAHGQRGMRNKLRGALAGA